MIRTALVILSGNAAAAILLLARNLIVARLIPVADYGIAATFALAMAVVEMASAFGLQQQIVQSKDGDDPRFQAALQGFQLLRGVISGLILVAVAWPLARFFGIPEVAWAYQVLALVPVLNALQHFDIHRLNRQMRFGPMLLAGVIPAAASLTLIWPLAQWFGDWQVMLWSILAQAVIAAATSHLVAERPWHLVWDRTIIAGSLRFGWPLLVNGLLMFLVFQGDKLIVGRVMGMEALAIFAMGVTLTLTPTLVLAKSAQNLFLPRLSQAEPAAATPVAMLSLQVVSLAALAFCFAVLLVGGPVVTLLLGEKYLALAPVLVWFGIAQAVRVMKAGPAIVAMARGHTANAMIANLVRVLALPVAWVVVQQSGSMLDVVFVAVAGEVAGLIVAFALALRQGGLPPRQVLLQQGAVLLGLLATGLWSFFHSTAEFAGWPVWVAAATTLLGLMVIMPETRGFSNRRGKR